MVEAEGVHGGGKLAPNHANVITSEVPQHEAPDIYLDEHCMDLMFSPTCNMLALGQISGAVRVYAYTENTMQEVITAKHH